MLGSVFNKIAGFHACNYIKERLKHRYFPVSIAKFSTLIRLDFLKVVFFWVNVNLTPLTFIFQGESYNININLYNC